MVKFLKFVFESWEFLKKAWDALKPWNWLRWYRQRTLLQVLRPLHLAILHRMRRLAAEVTDLDSDLDEPSQLAIQICTECRKLVSAHLGLQDNDLHCCLKVFVAGEGSDEPGVDTWVRSEPMDGRPVEVGERAAHPVIGNSVWAALLGESDGHFIWQVFRCFACNDLTRHNPAFRCDRVDWALYYRSTFVVPIRYPIDPHGKKYAYIGFLAFDSYRTDVFAGAPNIFEHREDQTAYDNKLEDCPLFHIAGIMADILGTFMRGVHQKAPPHKPIQGGQQNG